ncbi:MAG: hypothetical protein QNJ73_01355 [Gammaproteobacteria bacterium]|nr:hypothetical protein [Gammaproteobacteria bacterium]
MKTGILSIMHVELTTLIQSFENRTESLTGRTVALVAAIIADPVLHARFMNTLSMLEHMGSYKILETQRGAAIDQQTLKHVTEEARHAWFFKRQAERLAGRALDYAPAELVAPASAWLYFQKVEASVCRALGADAGSPAIYLLTSMIVEFRAIWFYRLYQTALDDAGFALSLKKLTGEEEVHLRDMAARLTDTATPSQVCLPSLLDAEQALYGRLLAGFERHCRRPASIAA